MYQYAYFIGCLILASVWILFYWLRRDLRKEMIFGSFLGLPFGVSEILFVHEYWNPPEMFNLIDKFGFGIEDLLFSFFVGGIAAVIYELITKSKIKKAKEKHKGFGAYILLAILFLGLEIVFPSRTIYNAFISFFVSEIYIAYLRPDLIREIIVSGFVFGILYLFLFVFFNQLFPDYIAKIYNVSNLIGINILNVPIEEVLFAFFLGGFWSVIYEYVRGYRVVLPKRKKNS